nr:RHS repeat-associated core domain-containing protein [uncultured Cellulosilyticum sp.]
MPCFFFFIRLKVYILKRGRANQYPNRAESFPYDLVGNRLSQTLNGETSTFIYNTKNQLTELHKDLGITNFTYDAGGNILKESSPQGTTTFSYNALNQQTKVTTYQGKTLVNRYDAEGLRAEIEENQKLTKFIFHKDEILVEADQEDQAISRLIRGYDVVAGDIADVEGTTGSNELGRYYYQLDEQFSTSFITNGNGKVENRYIYDAFGNILESQEGVHNRIKYTGQQHDPVTQQYYLRARFYNPILGRFMQEDVYRGDGLNLYAYCRNNPVMYYDPSGYMEITPINDTAEAYINRLNYIPKQDAHYGEWTGNRGESKFELKEYEDMTSQHKNAQGILKQYNETGVIYNNAMPEFDKFAVFTVDIDMTTDRPTNYKLTSDAIANEIVKYNGNSSEMVRKNAAGMKNAHENSLKVANGILDDKIIKKHLNNERLSLNEKQSKIASRLNTLREKNKLTVHELNNGKTVQLIPTDINGTFGHLGGVSEIKAQNQEIESEKKHG